MILLLLLSIANLNDGECFSALKECCRHNTANLSSCKGLVSNILNNSISKCPDAEPGTPLYDMFCKYLATAVKRYSSSQVKLFLEQHATASTVIELLAGTHNHFSKPQYLADIWPYFYLIQEDKILDGYSFDGETVYRLYLDTHVEESLIYFKNADANSHSFKSLILARYCSAPIDHPKYGRKVAVSCSDLKSCHKISINDWIYLFSTITFREVDTELLQMARDHVKIDDLYKNEATFHKTPMLYNNLYLVFRDAEVEKLVRHLKGCKSEEAAETNVLEMQHSSSQAVFAVLDT
eukprot:NODE_327_length_10929_cov_0.344137.p4 type:complete len:294 gc:universal NODE_327_length_10929_cov_0.344137:3881-4762(+)